MAVNDRSTRGTRLHLTKGRINCMFITCKKVGWVDSSLVFSRDVHKYWGIRVREYVESRQELI